MQVARTLSSMKRAGELIHEDAGALAFGAPKESRSKVSGNASSQLGARESIARSQPNSLIARAAPCTRAVPAGVFIEAASSQLRFSAD